MTRYILIGLPEKENYVIIYSLSHPSNIFYITHNKENHTGLERHEGE